MSPVEFKNNPCMMSLSSPYRVLLVPGRRSGECPFPLGSTGWEGGSQSRPERRGVEWVGRLGYTDHAGLEIFVHLRIASPFSRQIAIGNAGPSTALEPMGAKPSFRCHFLNIALQYKQ